jgi:hypothetical protein
MGFVLKEKLKVLKATIREWHKKEVGGLESRINFLTGEIKDLDIKGERGGCQMKKWIVGRINL